MAFRVLVVDDETAIREAIRMTLEYEGYRVDEARSGQDALDKATNWTAGFSPADHRFFSLFLVAVAVLPRTALATIVDFGALVGSAEGAGAALVRRTPG